MEAPRRLADFVAAIASAVERGGDERAVLAGARGAMRDLVAADDWLPDAMARPHPKHDQQYLLHLDPARRFSVVSFVWGPGQQTPIHDHTVWGVIGMLRGAEIATPFTIGDAVTPGRAVRLEPGDVECVGPRSGDVHRVANAYADRVSISIHCYGADIGAVRRHVYDPVSGAAKGFVSGYANAAGDAA
jgi:predicted metal-dependent enzyme (double-stranded beta helix superfamily)